MGGKSKRGEQTRPDWQAATPHPCGGGACLCPGIDESAWVPDGSPLAVAARARRRVGARGGEVTVSGGRKAALGQARGAGLG